MYISKKYILIFLFFFLNISSLNASEKIAFIDIDYILYNSNLGKLIFKDLETVNKENIKNCQKEIIIKQKKDKINKTKNISSKEQLEKDILNFNNDAEKFQLEKDKILKDFKLLKETKLDSFLKINPLIQEYMKKFNRYCFREKQIFIGSSSIDITNEIIKLVNENTNNE